MRDANHKWHDERLIELAALIAVTILIAAGVRYLNEPGALPHTSFIVPSQTVKW